jgi:RNA polymerase sigma factor (sigma-70 family)
MATGQVNPLVSYIRRLAAPPAAQLSDRELLRRFATQRDESAFTTLVQRHGPMVLNVGRRVLHNDHDAEDVFQATFLVLLRKAATLRWQRSVGNWLYEVAYRLALKAKTAAARRTLHEAQVPQSQSADLPAELTWRELQTLLDEELHRLPASYRVPLILCYLEGTTRDEAAHRLGWSLSTLKRRLERGREQLRLRLVRRGLTVSAALFAPMLMQNTAQATLDPGLIQATLRTVLQLEAGRALTELVSAPIAALAKGGLKTMFLTKLKVATAMLVAAGVFVSAGALARQVLTDKRAALPSPAAYLPKNAREQPIAKLQPAVIKDDANQTVEISGHVLDPEGKPVAGAKLYQAFWVEFIEHNMPPAPKLRGTSGPDGRFHFTISKPDFDKSPKAVPQLIAVADGFGPDWVRLDKPSVQELSLRLAKDDMPITGQILDLEGRPIHGAVIRPSVVMTTPNEDLTLWFQAIQQKKRFQHREILTKQLIGFPQGIPGLPRTVTTGADGRFRLAGIGRERVVGVQISGPKVRSHFVMLVTRAVPKFQVYDNPSTDSQFTVYGTVFQHFAAPAQPMVGTVRDKDTGKPLAGVKIDAETLFPVATDKDGKYRFESLPNDDFGSKNNFGVPVLAIPPGDQPYLVGFKEVKPGPGLEATTVNFELKRGLWAQGQVTNKLTGKPVRAYIEYHVSADNPHRLDAADLTRFPTRLVDLYPTRADGTFRVPVLPGPGVITARGPHGEYVAAGSATINPDQHAQSVQCPIGLDPGRILTGTILGPDGKPLPGARVFNMKPLHFWTSQPLETASFTLTGVDPRGRRSMVFLHPEKRLAAALELQGNAQSPLTIQLKPAGTVTGRLVEEDGEPRPGVELLIHFVRKENGYVAEHLPNRITTDREGRFRVEGLAPGLVYQINLAGKRPTNTLGSVATHVSIRSGEVKDQGDVKGRLFQD